MTSIPPRSIAQDFFIDPVNALLLLEQEGILSDTLDEQSPLRRLNKRTSGKLPIFFDSRSIQEQLARPPVSEPEFIFFARKGVNFDGHTLAEKVLESGNIFVGQDNLIRQDLDEKSRPNLWVEDILAHPYLIHVTDSEQALKNILEKSCEFGSQNFTSLAVTGTNGKTSVTQIASQLIHLLSGRPVMNIGTLGIQIGETPYENPYPTMPNLPGFLAACREAYELKVKDFVFEATSHGLIENRMGKWKADVAIYTNLTQDHLDFHKTMDNYRHAKGLLFKNHIKEKGSAVIHAEGPHWEYFADEGSSPNKKTIGFGTSKNKRAFFERTFHKYKSTVFLSSLHRSIGRSGIKGIWQLEDTHGLLAEVTYKCRLIGDFQHENLTAAAAGLLALGYSLESIAQMTMNVQPIPGRLELVTLEAVQSLAKETKTQKLPTVIVDYAHSPDALAKTLSSCRGMVGEDGKLIVVFGCGGDRDRSKRPLMGKIACKEADVCIVTSDNPRTENPNAIIAEILEGSTDSEKVIKEPDRRLAIQRGILHALPNDLVVIAGKGHENYQIIDAKKLPFDDVEIAREALLLKTQQGSPNI